MNAEELDELMTSHGWVFYCKNLVSTPSSRAYHKPNAEATDRPTLCNLLALDDTLRVVRPELGANDFLHIYHP